MIAKEPNLTIAGRMIIGSIAGHVALATYLPELAGLAFASAWAVNFITAWFISKAAHALGKNRILFGVLSAVAPPLSIYSYLELRNHQIWSSLN